MKKEKISIIVPVFNEEANIVALLDSIVNQVDYKGNKVPCKKYQVVFVDNNSNDNTVKIIRDFFNAHSDVEYYIINETEQGIIPTRISGFKFIQRPELLTEYAASLDADVVLHKNWLHKTLEVLKTDNIDAISYEGDFGCDFWKRVPNLLEQYVNAVGTVYFDYRTIKAFDLNNSSYSNQIFHDFIRPLSSACCAFKTDSYFKAGGFVREYDEENNEMLAESWRLMFEMDRLNMKFVYIEDVPFETSPRRVINDPLHYFGIESNSIEHISYRNVDIKAYERLNLLAKDMPNFKHNQIEYVIKYYIIMRCITNPTLVVQNGSYFALVQNDFLDDVKLFNCKKRNSSSNIFKFSNEMYKKYGKEIEKNIELNR